jgi:hypothetical protein
VDIPDDLVDVLGEVSPSRTRLELDREEILEGALSSLDLRAEDGFAADIHVDEEVRVRNGLDNAVEATDSLIRARQKRLETLESDRRIGRKRRRDERRVACALFHVAAGARSSGGHRFSLVR